MCNIQCSTIASLKSWILTKVSIAKKGNIERRMLVSKPDEWKHIQMIDSFLSALWLEPAQQ